MENLKRVLVIHERDNVGKEGILDKTHNLVYVNPVSIELLSSFGYQIKENPEELKDVSLHGRNGR